MKENIYDILAIRDYYPSVNNPTSSTWVLNQVIGLQNLGYSPLVLSPTPINPLRRVLKQKFHYYDKPSNQIETYKDTHVKRPPYLKFPLNKFKKFTIERLSNTIIKHGDLPGIKMIHAHFGQNGVAALPLKEKLKVPMITSFYGYDSGRLGRLFKPYYSELIKKGDLFLALSNDMKQDLIKLGFPEHKIIIHRLGIDLDKFTSAFEPNETFTILTVARFTETKGIHYVLKALHLFFKIYPDEKQRINYTIVGGGYYESNIKELIERLDLKHNVCIIDNLSVPNGREIVLSEMKKCNLFALCSSTPKSGGKEGTPVVLMEAQACGKPCISTFHAGIPEVVINNKTGILVNEHSPEEITKAITQLYFDKKKRDHFGNNARTHIHSFYNQKLQMIALKQIYENLLHNNNFSYVIY